MEACVPRVVDPFARSKPTRPWKWRFVELLVAFTLFPVRIVVLACSMVLALLFIPVLECYSRCCVPAAGAGGGMEDTVPPLGAGATFVLYPLRLLARAMLWAIGVWWIHVERCEGCASSLSEARVVTPNHIQELDPIFMFWLMSPTFVGKSDITQRPVVGSIAKVTQLILVDRKDRDSKHRVLNAIKRRANDTRFPALCIFPEGTTTNGRALIRFQKGAFITGQPVQPVVFRYQSPVIDAEALPVTPLALGLLMVQPYLRVTITLLPLHYPAQGGGPDSFAEDVRQAMALAKGVPMTRHDYDDFFFRQFAKRNNINLAQNFELAQLTQLFKVDVSHLQQLLQRFAAVDTSGTGSIDVVDLCKAVGLKPNCDEAKDLFLLFDRDSDGAIDFVDFAQTIALMSENVNANDFLNIVFSVLTQDEDGRVSVGDITERLASAQRVIQAKEAAAANVLDQGDGMPTKQPSSKELEIARFTQRLSDPSLDRQRQISREDLARMTE